MNLVLCSDTKINPQPHKKNISPVTCHVSCVTCHMPQVTCHILPTPTATAPNPFPANSPTMDSRLFHQYITPKPKFVMHFFFQPSKLRVFKSCNLCNTIFNRCPALLVLVADLKKPLE